MRSKLAVAGLILILLVVNFQIYRNEQKQNSGATLILELAPLDPRSLMQGDYMTLRYKIAAQIPTTEDGGVVYFDPDSRGLVTTVSTTPGSGRVKLKFWRLDGRVQFGIDSYLFQEGKQSEYERARFAEIRVSEDGIPAMVRLLDKQLNPIGKQL